MLDNNYNRHEVERGRKLMERAATLHWLYDSHGEGRRYRRFELEFPVQVKFQSESTDREIQGVSKNMSIGGLLIRLTQPIPESTPVTFLLSVHGKQSVRPVHLRGEGMVVRVENGEAEKTFLAAVRCQGPLMQLEAYLPM